MRSRKHIWIAVGFCLGLTLFSLGKAAVTSELIGFSGGEVFGHAWTHWWRGEQLPQWAAGTDLTVGTSVFPAIDPIPTLISALFTRLGGPSFGYNSWVFFAVFLTACGGYVLSLREQGDPFIGALVLAWSPLYLGAVESGLTEDMGLGIVALALALLKNRPIWSGILMVVVGWCGLVLGWLSGILAVLLGCRIWWSGSKQVFVSGFVTVLGTAPLLYIHWDRISLKGHRFGIHQEIIEPFWWLNPWRQVDAASLFWLGGQDYGSEIIRIHPGYLGVSLCVVGLFSRSFFWWGVFVFFIAMSFGSTIYWQGANTGLSNPIHALCTFIPGHGLLNHHGRCMLMAAIALSVLTAKGIKNIPRPQIWKTLIALELIFFSPIGVIASGTKTVSSPVLDQVSIEDGRLLRVPTVGPGISFQRALWEQSVHKEPLLLNPNRPGASPLLDLDPEQAAWIDRLAFRESADLDIDCVPDEIGGILATDSVKQLLQQRFGKAKVADSQYAFWSKTELMSARCNSDAQRD